MNRKSKAEIYLYALKQGFIESEKIVEWVDQIIKTETNPPEWAISISVANQDDIIPLLTQVHGEVDIHLVWTGIKSEICTAVINNQIEVVEGIAELNSLMQDKIAPVNEHEDIKYFVMNWDCINEGHGSLEEFKTELTQYLKQ